MYKTRTKTHTHTHTTAQEKMMKTLGATTSYLNFFSCKQRVVLCSREIAQSKQEIGFLRYQKRVIDGYERVISSQHNKYIHSISAAQKNVGSDELHTIYADPTKTTRVRFELHKECAFGEQFMIVGDDPIFGSWEPSNAVPLNWCDGHIWTAEMDIPIGKVINYKFILKGDIESVVWQPGPDRILEIRDSEKTVIVFEDWDNYELQNIVEENISIVDENLNEIIMDERLDVIKELANVNGGYVNHVEKISPPMVAENIVLESEGRDLSLNDEGSGLKSAKDEKKDEVVNLSSSKDEMELVLDEGVPVLVPGLIPMSFEEVNEPEEINYAKPRLSPMSFEDINEPEVINNPELLNEVEKNEVEYDEVKELTMAELKDEHVSATSLHSTESNEMMAMIDEKEQTHEKDIVLETDMQWGRRTLQRFLANFGFQ